MAETKYSEYLKDIRWVTKRKRIILRDGKQCTVCNAKKNLQVHHTFYYTDYREPWRYPDESLLTLCKDCHQTHHEHSELKYKEPPKRIVNKRKVKKAKVKKVMTLKELYKIWEPKMNKKKYRLIKYDK